MKICVYSICKNEGPFVDRFMASVIDADSIVICDTGSNDNTLTKLESWRLRYPNKINIHQITVFPWRFDHARNMSLDLIPDDIDICVCIDLDEVLSDNWKKVIKSFWTPDTTRLRYHYVWNWAANGNPGVVQQSDKIHARKGYVWKHCCHEVLYSNNVEVQTHIPNDCFAVYHYPDNSKPRNQYLSLLELDVRENPDSDRSSYYLAREYFFYGRYDDAILEFERHRTLPSLTWDAERASSHRFEAKALTHLNRLHEACHHFEEATRLDTHYRDGWNDLAMIYYKLENWQACYDAAIHALSIVSDYGTYIMDQQEAFGPKASDLASISAWYLGKIDDAINHCSEAILLNPDDERLKNNLLWFCNYSVSVRSEII